MKKLNVIVWLLLSICIQAQNEWMNLIAPDKINDIKEIGNKYYCATDGGLLIYDLQTNSVERLTLKDGLPSLRIEDIAVDNNANIWIGTYDNGLAMRQGNGWTHIPTPLDDSNQNTSLLYCLEFDQFNNLWIGTEEGLFKYVDEEWESISLSSSHNNASLVWDMQRDEEGNIYMASHWPYKLEGTNFIEYQNNNTFAYGKASIDYDDTGKLYFGTDVGTIAIIEGDEWTVYDGFGYTIVDLEVMENGDVWASLLTGGVHKFSNGAWTNVLEVVSPNTNTQLLKNSNGDIIVGLKDKLYKANDEYVVTGEELVDLAIQFPNNNLDITVNEDQQILVRSDNRLLKFDDSTLQTSEINPPVGMENYHDLKTVNFPDKTIGFFDYETGSIYYENQTISIYDPFTYFGTNVWLWKVNDVFVDSEDGYWVSTNRGLIYNTQGQITFFDETNTPFPITSTSGTAPTFRKILEDRNNNIWVSSPAGIGVWNRNTQTWIFYDGDSTGGMSANISSCLYFDENNVLWASGTYGTGLIRFDGNNWSRFTPLNSNLPSGYIRDIHPWEDMLILATHEGLAFFSGDKFKTFTKQNSGIASNYCKTIEQDMHGNIWIAHEKTFDGQNYGGISIFNKNGITFSDKDLPQLDIPVVESIILNEGQLLGMNVYPNPAGKFLNVDFSIFNQKVNKIQLIDEYGKIHFSKNISQGENQLKIYTGNLISGAYILQANAGKQIESQKIIIQ